MPLPLEENLVSDEYRKLIQQRDCLIRERNALGQMQHKNRAQRTRLMRLRHDIIPGVVERIRELQQYIVLG